MYWLAVFLLAVHLLNPISLRGSEQSAAVITDLGTKPEFGKQITFQVRIQPVNTVQKLLVYITPQAQPTVWQEIPLDKANAKGEIAEQVDVRQLALYPFSKVAYHYEATLLDGSKVETDPVSFSYDDDRFTWKGTGSGIFEVHWYSDDATLGQMIINAAQKGLSNAQGLLKIDPPTLVRIYAYTSSRDLQSALQMTNRPWIAGHATPELSLILISVPSGPEKKLEIERQVPHEIMHILQYQVTGQSYQKQPMWLMEGMASVAELYTNPEYRTMLQSAAKSNNLIPLRTLCAAFPNDAAGTSQAYAQSESFVRFLYTKYGAPGLQKLIAQYQDGLGCEEGFAAAMGSSLNQLEYRWQQEALGINLGGLVLSNLSPYLLLGLLLLVPAALAIYPFRKKAARKGNVS